MKFIIASIATLLYSSPFALAEDEFAINQINLLVQQLRPESSLGSGLAAVNQACIDETNALSSSVSYKEGQCQPEITGKRKGEIDFDSCSATGKFKISCAAAGGEDTILHCAIKLSS